MTLPMSFADSAAQVLAMLATNEHTVICNQTRLSRVHEGVLFRNTGHAILDFDGTATSGSQWEAMAMLMSPPLAVIDSRTRQWFYSQQDLRQVSTSALDSDDPWSYLDPRNQAAAEGAWLAQTVSFLARSDVSADAIRHQAEQVGIRHGFLDLVGLMQRRAIITFGTKQFPLWWCQHHGIAEGMDIRGTNLHFNENGLLTHCALNVCTADTKGHDGQRWMAHHGLYPHEVLVVADSPSDGSMFFEASTNVLLIPRSDTDSALARFRRNNLSSVWPRVDIVLHSDSLAALVQMIRAARRSGR